MQLEATLGKQSDAMRKAIRKAGVPITLEYTDSMYGYKYQVFHLGRAEGSVSLDFIDEAYNAAKEFYQPAVIKHPEKGYISEIPPFHERRYIKDKYSKDIKEAYVYEDILYAILFADRVICDVLYKPEFIILENKHVSTTDD